MCRQAFRAQVCPSAQQDKGTEHGAVWHSMIKEEHKCADTCCVWRLMHSLSTCTWHMHRAECSVAVRDEHEKIPTNVQASKKKKKRPEFCTKASVSHSVRQLCLSDTCACAVHTTCVLMCAKSRGIMKSPIQPICRSARILQQPRARQTSRTRGPSQRRLQEPSL
jgi:hypothetical protein